MNQNFSGAALLLIIAAAGIATANPVAYGLAALTAMLAFLAAELRAMEGHYFVPQVIILIVALGSWLTTLAAFVSLFV